MNWQCPQAFATYGYYNYANPSLNKPGVVVAYLRHDSLRQGRSNLDGIDVKASRELMQLPGGALCSLRWFRDSQGESFRRSGHSAADRRHVRHQRRTGIR